MVVRGVFEGHPPRVQDQDPIEIADDDAVVSVSTLLLSLLLFTSCSCIGSGRDESSGTPPSAFGRGPFGVKFSRAKYSESAYDIMGGQLSAMPLLSSSFSFSEYQPSSRRCDSKCEDRCFICSSSPPSSLEVEADEADDEEDEDEDGNIKEFPGAGPVSGKVLEEGSNAR